MGSEWWADYIGIPFSDHGRDRGGCDCWGLVRLVYAHRLGIDLPSYDGYEHVKDGAAFRRMMPEVIAQFERNDTPHELDVVLILQHAGRLHVGVMVDMQRMLHIEVGKDACIEPIKPYQNLIDGFYSYKAA